MQKNPPPTTSLPPYIKSQKIGAVWYIEFERLSEGERAFIRRIITQEVFTQEIPRTGAKFLLRYDFLDMIPEAGKSAPTKQPLHGRILRLMRPVAGGYNPPISLIAEKVHAALDRHIP